jgi:glucose/arabinose dehydrogenase
MRVELQKIASGCIATLLVLAHSTDPARAVQLKPQVITTTGLSNPVFGAAPPGEAGVLYISEQNNVAIRVLDLQSNALTTFLDLPDIAGDQSGLQRFAFHPSFETNGKIYLNVFDSTPAPEERFVKIFEFQRSESDPNIIDPTTERLLLSIANPSGSHNGGWLDFSPTDGYLYILTGDGGAISNAALRGVPAQDLNDLRGKLLRIDVNGDDFPEDPDRNYSIPDDNPFASGGGRPEIFSYGLRHPFSAGFDAANGDLYIADVGSSHYDEVNFVPAGTSGGQNFGWRPREGLFDNPTFADPSPPGAIDPIHSYPIGSGAAIISSVVYRGDDIPGLQGHYMFADFVRDDFFTFQFDGTAISSLTDRSVELANPAITNGTYGGILFGTDSDGEIFYFDPIRGDVFKIVQEIVPGDYSGNGVVDAADYVLWRNSAGQSIALSGENPDAITPGVVDQEDYEFWKLQFGASGGGGTAVPEPSTFQLLLCLFSICCRAAFRAGAR